MDNKLFCCAICLENMLDRKPRALSCLHTFCQDCLVDMTKSIQGESSTGAITCPTCRQETPISGRGIPDLPLNFSLLSMKDILEKETSTGKQHSPARYDDASEGTSLKPPPLPPKLKDLCTSCKNEGKKTGAVVKCMDCGEQYCADHNERHQKVVIYQYHRKEYLIQERCKLHGKRRNLVCKTCVKVLCNTCAMSAEHENHLYSLVKYEVALKEATTDVNVLINELHTKIAKVDELILSMEETSTSLNTLRTLITQRATDMKSRIVDQVNSMDQELTIKYQKPASIVNDMLSNRITDIERKIAELPKFEKQASTQAFLQLSAWHRTADILLAEHVEVPPDLTTALPRFNSTSSDISVGELKSPPDTTATSIFYRKLSPQDLNWMKTEDKETSKRRSMEAGMRRAESCDNLDAGEGNRRRSAGDPPVSAKPRRRRGLKMLGIKLL